MYTITWKAIHTLNELLATEEVEKQNAVSKYLLLVAVSSKVSDKRIKQKTSQISRRNEKIRESHIIQYADDVQGGVKVGLHI